MSERGKNREKLESLLDKWNAEFDKFEAKIRAGADPKVYCDDSATAAPLGGEERTGNLRP